MSAVTRKRFREHRIGLGQQAKACRRKGTSGQGIAEENHHPLFRTGRGSGGEGTWMHPRVTSVPRAPKAVHSVHPLWAGEVGYANPARKNKSK